MFIFHCVSREVTAERWGKVMAKPLANHVIAGRRHEHTYAHSQSALTPRLLLPDTQTSALFFVKVMGTVASSRFSGACVRRTRRWSRTEGFTATLWKHRQHNNRELFYTHWIVSLLLVEMVFRMTKTVCPCVCVCNECLHPEILQSSPPPGLKGECLRVCG